MLIWEDIQVYFWVGFAVSAIACGGFSAYLADIKGRSSGSWLILGLLFGVFALIAVAGLPQLEDLVGVSGRDQRLRKKCPMCAETVKIEAQVCRYCGHSFDDEEETTARLETITMQDEGLAVATQAQELLAQLRNRPST